MPERRRLSANRGTSDVVSITHERIPLLMEPAEKVPSVKTCSITLTI